MSRKRVLDRYIVKFLDLFKINNDIEEKNITGFLAMSLLSLIAITEVVLNAFGIPYTTNPDIYEAFLWIVLGSFGISAIGHGIEKGMRNPYGRRRRTPSQKRDLEEDRIQENLENQEEENL